MRVIQCVHSHDAYDLYTITSLSCTRKDSCLMGWGYICNYAAIKWVLGCSFGGIRANLVKKSRCLWSVTHDNMFALDGSVMDCHVKARGSIPGGNGVFTSFTSFMQGTVNGGAISKWPRCWRDVKHKQTNKSIRYNLCHVPFKSEQQHLL